jgi:hypothetical protein
MQRYLSRDQAGALVAANCCNLIRASSVGQGGWFPEKPPLDGFWTHQTVASLEARKLVKISNKDTARITAAGRKEAAEIIAASRSLRLRA